jgi:hypothetical protein
MPPVRSRLDFDGRIDERNTFTEQGIPIMSAPHAHVPLRSLLLGVSVAALLAIAVLVPHPESPPTVEAQTLAARGELHWQRGNLHTHSLWSDGDDFLENIALWYRERDYDFLLFTDHNVVAWTERWIDIDKAKSGRKAFDRVKHQFPDGLEERMKDGRHEVRLRTFHEVQKLVARPDFLLIQGEEISDRFGKLPLHLNAGNVQELLPPRGGDSVTEVLQNNVDSVIAQRERTKKPIYVHVNHPNFGWGVTAEDLMPVRGENFFEVYNGHPGVHNTGDAEHASTERIWDIILTKRLTELDLPLMYGVATDDGHSYHSIPSRASEPGRGWVMVLAHELTPHALVTALEAGQFYASSGVTLAEVTSSTNGIEVKVQAESGVTYKTEFVGTRKNADLSSEPVRDKDGNELPVTRKYSADIGTVLATLEGPVAKYECRGDELYVRAKVTSSRPHPNPSEPGDLESAWVQPVRGPGAK